jgi:hypothetical protein
VGDRVGVANTDEGHFLVKLGIKLQDKYTSPSAELDSGSTLFAIIHPRFVAQHNIPLIPLTRPLTVRRVDDTNIVGLHITHRTPSYPVTIASHSWEPRIWFLVMDIGARDILLGLPWLRKHNPEIDWTARTIRPRTEAHTWRAAPAPNTTNNTTDAPPPRTPARVPPPLPPNVPEFYAEFADVFDAAAAELLPPSRGKHDFPIELQPGKTFPRAEKNYNMTADEDVALHEVLDKGLRNGTIVRSSAESANPVFFVKQNGKKRLCFDLRRKNDMIIGDHYSLPNLADMVTEMSGCDILTSVDVKSAYHQILIRSGDAYKTAFRTKYGTFETLVLYEGWKSAPSHFQRFADEITATLKHHHVYLDDNAIGTKGLPLSEHIEAVKALLLVFRKWQIYLNPAKCVFHAEEIKFGGFIVGKQGVRLTDGSQHEVNLLPRPTSLRSVQAVLGLLQHFQRWIPHFTEVVRPMQELTKQGVPFVWGPEHERSFLHAQALVASAPVLHPVNTDKPFVTYTDAAQYGIGAGLFQEDEHGFLRLIEFWARKLVAAERNYTINDKELLAIVETLKHWRHWLSGSKHPVEIRTDHRNLLYFIDKKRLTPRHARWALEMGEFDFVLRDIPGTQNVVADALSRNPAFTPTAAETTDDREHVLLPAAHFLPRPPYAHTKPPEVAALHTVPTDKSGGGLPQQSTTQAPHESLGVPPDTRRESAKLTTAGVTHRSLVIPILIDDDEHYTYIEEFDDATIAALDTVLSTGPVEWVTDPQRKLEILRIFHDHHTAGHPNWERTDTAIRAANYDWEGRRTYVNNYVRSCDSCQRNKSSRTKPYGQLFPLAAPSSPWTHISLDLIVKLPPSIADGHTYDAIFVIVCRHTKMGHFIPCNEAMTAEEAARIVIVNIFRIHGMPLDIVSDRGPHFASKFWQTFWRLLGVHPSLTTAFHPQGDGQTERVNQTAENILRHVVNYEQDNWATELPFAEFAYNNTVHATTKVTPFYANYLRHPLATPFSPLTVSSPSADAERTAEHLLDVHARMTENIIDAQAKWVKHAAKHRQDSPFKVGDLVWVQTRNMASLRPAKKLDFRKIGPYPIIAQINPVTYRVQLPPDVHVHPVFHASLLTPHIPNTISDRHPAPPPPVRYQDAEYEEHEVAGILNVRKRGRRWEWLVDWQGYGPGDRTWEPKEHLGNANVLLLQYHRQHPTKPQPAAIRAHLSAETARK